MTSRKFDKNKEEEPQKHAILRTKWDFRKIPPRIKIPIE
jgi:hypothetical protein